MEDMHFNLPEHAPQARSLGYAWGLTAGLITVAQGGLPPQVPFMQARGPISANDPEEFHRIFSEGYDLGFQFGVEAAFDLTKALNTVPSDLWWPVSLFFSGEVITGEQTLEEMPEGSDREHIERGVDAFRQIYRKRLH